MKAVLTFVTYLRALVMSVVNVLVTLLVSITVFILGSLGQQHMATSLIRVWAWILLSSFGIRVEVEGEEKIPRVGGGIIVFNHQSHLDIPSLILATTQQIRFGAKVELFKIPFFGVAMASIGTLKIARENRNEVLRIYQEAAKRFDDGILFVLAPEGTRQKEPRLGRFKKGPFVFAINAKVPVVPAVIKGAYDVLPAKELMVNIGRWRRVIKVKFLPPIESSRFSNETLDAMTGEAYDQMNSTFEAM